MSGTASAKLSYLFPTPEGWTPDQLTGNFRAIKRALDYYARRAAVRLAVEHIDGNLTGTTAATVLKQASLAAGEMGARGALRITAWGGVSGTAGGKEVHLRFTGNGSTQDFSLAWAAPDTGTYLFQAWIHNIDVEDSQVYIVKKYFAALNAIERGSLNFDTGPTGTPANACVVISIIGDLADGADSITSEGLLVELLPAAADIESE